MSVIDLATYENTGDLNGLLPGESQAGQLQKDRNARAMRAGGGRAIHAPIMTTPLYSSQPCATSREFLRRDWLVLE